MFNVAPSGITKEQILLEIPLFSQQVMVKGNVAELLAVPKATIIASVIAVYNFPTGTLEKTFSIIGYTKKN